MSRIVATTVGAWLVAVSASVMSADLQDGLYRLSDEGAGIPVTRTWGGKIGLGERLTGNLGEVSIWSMSNENDHFRLLMTGAGPVSTSGQLVLCVAGVCEVVGSYSEPDADGKVELIADISGHAPAVKLAKALDVELQERKHPGHQMLVTWTPVKESFKLGEPVEVELQITNVGQTVVRFMDGGQQRGFRNNQFGFTAFAASGSGKALPDVGDPTNFGGIAALQTLKPGDKFQKRVTLDKWFKFEKPDVYQVTGMFELELQEEDFGPRVLWSDFATGRCFVRISD